MKHNTIPILTFSHHQISLLLVRQPLTDDIKLVVGDLEILHQAVQAIIEETHRVHESDIVQLENLELLSVDWNGLQADGLAVALQLPLTLSTLSNGMHHTMTIIA